MAEILFKVGDSGGSKDGDILAVKPDGWLIPGVAMRAWIEDGVEPAILVEMPGYLQRRARRGMSRLRWTLEHTAAEVAKEFDLGDEKMGTEEKAVATKDADYAKTNGSDTSWGRDDLKIHATVRVEGLTLHDIQELLDRRQDVDHIGRIHAKRLHTFEFRKVLSAEVVSRMSDKEQRVDVDRQHPLTRAELFGAVLQKREEK